jgi:hypothetical protein
MADIWQRILESIVSIDVQRIESSIPGISASTFHDVQLECVRQFAMALWTGPSEKRVIIG